jgi:hypothetical protein
MVGVACEQERTDTYLIESLEGRWLVKEDDSQYDESTYHVNISISSEDSSKIYISNFYMSDEGVRATVKGQRIIIDPNDQKITNITTYTIKSGSGTITDDYRNIDWRYEVDDGTGTSYEVTAIYEKE